MTIQGKTLLFGKWLTEIDFVSNGADNLVKHASKVGIEGAIGIRRAF